MVGIRRPKAKRQIASVPPAMAEGVDHPLTLALLGWYDRHRRVLPWRVLPGETSDVYRVWLSEIMLQQTTVETVKPYFARFLARWPDVRALAAADEQVVLAAWAGLGYYARARNLLACARKVAGEHGGVFPDSETGLRGLPGIGSYTAAAIAVIALNHPAIVVDGNIERVVTRLNAIPVPLPAAKPAIRAALAPLVPDARPGDFAQALMDLGASVCTPRQPACPSCPLRAFCMACAAGVPGAYPVKKRKKAKPVKFGIAYVLRNGDDDLLLTTRPGKGLLAHMTEVPNSGWQEDAPPPSPPPLAAAWQGRPTGIVHVFTHFELRMEVRHARVAGTPPAPQGMRWVSADRLADEPLPTLFAKIIASVP